MICSARARLADCYILGYRVDLVDMSRSLESTSSPLLNLTSGDDRDIDSTCSTCPNELDTLFNQRSG